MRSTVLIFFIVLTTFNLFSQNKEITIVFNPKFNGDKLELDKQYNFNNDTIAVSNLKFYISSIQFFKDDTLTYTIAKQYHLLNIENTSSLTISDSIDLLSSFNYMVFNLGIDSITNVSGVFGNDLDPTNGMYWTWQSGYINFKLEGTSMLCKARNNVFQFHLGGYQYPFSSVQKIKLPIENNNIINIDIKLEKFLKTIDLSSIFEVMSPGQEAVDLSKNCSKIFEISK
ncbi:MAG: MbnP family protein [Flavobacteriales bacterium]